MDYLEKRKRRPNPREKANIVSNLFFVDSFKLFRNGFKTELKEDDLYEVLPSYESKFLGDRIEKEWDKQKKNCSIAKLLWNMYGMYYFCLGVLDLVVNTLSLIVRPYAMGKLISYFVPGQTILLKEDAYYYASLLISVNFVNCIYKHNYFFFISGIGIKMRAAVCSLIYRRVLKMKPFHLGNISIGKIVTLLTKDVLTLETCVDFVNDAWEGIIRTIGISFMLYMKIGPAALAGIGFIFIIIPIQISLGRFVTNMKMKSCKKTDERLQLTQEILSAIRIIKMYTWEKFFTTKVEETRREEVRAIYNHFLLKFSLLVIGGLTSHIAFYILLITYIWLGYNITAEVVYYIDTCFSDISFRMSVLFPIGVYQIAELISAIKRIGNVLKIIDTIDEEISEDLKASPKIHLKNVTIIINDKPILHQINVNVDSGLTFISGPVGSGKSTLLKTILRDFKTHDGSVFVQGRLSYASQEPWLFPSSIRQNIIFGQEYNEKRYEEVLKVCALVYDFELLEEGDGTIVEDRGINLSKGQQSRINLARAVYKDSDIYLLDDCLAALDAHVSSFIFKECILKFLKDKLVVVVTHNSNHLKEGDNVIVLNAGEVKFTVKSSKQNENEILGMDDMIIPDIIKKIKNVIIEEENADEETRLLTNTTSSKMVYQETKEEGDVGNSVYMKYIQLGGGYFALFLVITLFLSAQVVISYSDKLVSDWTNFEQKAINITSHKSTNSSEYEEITRQRATIFYTYTLITIANAITTFGRVFSLVVFTNRASLKLHNRMIHSIINASMKFFDNNFIGNILNRFSKDLTVIDEVMPFNFYQVFRILFIFLGVITLIVSVNVMFLVPTAIFFSLCFMLRRCCLRTTRSLKRMDAATKSPMVGHLNASLEGLTTIRAFKAEAILRDEFDLHQDLYTSATYSLMTSMRAFSLLLDILCALFTAIIILRFFIGEGHLAGTVGLVISQTYLMTRNVQWGVHQWTEVENQMTSVERVCDYSEVTQEKRDGVVLEDWPKFGEILYKDVFLSYTNSKECVLKNINFLVKAQEKIGVVGRTGAGKSSIISTLFRMYDVEGTIKIDGVDTKSLSLDFLRKHISIIPQDPVLFTGTIRENIDPTGIYTDEEIWRAIDVAHLKTLVPSLDFEITEGGANFSVGQRQLICVARAVTRNNKIIVLDEATANMDKEMDDLIHQTIHKCFNKCTVFTIAHKLHSIMNCDKVMVLDKGEIIQYDHPDQLLKNTNGSFYKMVEKSGLLPVSK